MAELTPSGTSGSSSRPVFPPITQILLVEDIPAVRQWLRTLVSQLFPNAFITESATVHDALAYASAMRFHLALVDLGLPDGSGTEVIEALTETQPQARSVVVTIHDDDGHLFPALQAGAFGYVLKDQPMDQLAEQLHRITQGEPPLSPSVARRVIAHFKPGGPRAERSSVDVLPEVRLTEREHDVLLRVAKGYTLPEIAVQLGLSRHTISDYVKNIYRKLNVSSRAEAALEAQRLGLFRSAASSAAMAR